MDLGLPAINTLDESSVFGTPATRIIRPTDVSRWSTRYYVFGETKAIGKSVAKLDHDYSYKTDFVILRENRNLSAKKVQ